ncbi:MAG: winged helix-turn-helix domain-containing protein [Pseudomonadota bacterium]
MLRKGNSQVHLRPRSFRLLEYFVRNHGQVKSKSEIIDAVWGPVAITDDTVTQSVVDIRRALGDTDRSMVKTLPRRGYMFNVEVSLEDSESSDQPARVNRPFGHSAGLLTLGVAALLSGIFALFWYERESGPPYSIAVLSFDDLSPNRSLRYFADGVSQEVLHALAQLPNLRVVAHRGPELLPVAAPDVAECGSSDLETTYVLEGSVRQFGGHFRISAQLIETRTRAQLWSETFAADRSKLFAAQDQLASAVAQVLKMRMSQGSALPNTGGA